MELALINKIIVVLISAIGLWLAFWVLFSNRKSRVNQMFFLLIFFILLRIPFAYFAVLSKEANISLVFTKLNFGLISFVVIFSYFFFIYFPKESKRHPILDKIIIFVWLLLFYLSVFTDLIIKDTDSGGLDFKIVFGKGIPYFYLATIIVIFLVFFNFFRGYFALPKQKKLKVQYILIGTFIFGLSLVVFNVLFPAILKTTKYVLLGEYSVIFMLGFTGYAIVKRELFGVKVVLTQLLVAVMGTVLLLLPFLVPVLWLKILLLSIFLLFCIFGYLLIKSTLREVRQKEILEQRVKQRTKELEKRTLELEKAKKALEGAKGILEIKVRARTKELQELNETLEEKVKLRTKELQERVDELSRWYKLTIGRELKMVELKKEIEKIKKERREEGKENF